MCSGKSKKATGDSFGAGVFPVGIASTSVGKSAKTIGSLPSPVGIGATSFGKWGKVFGRRPPKKNAKY